jgi:hypothetical protein
MTTAPACKRCRHAPATIAPYWATGVELCGPCATEVADELDALDRWPPVPWSDDEATTSPADVPTPNPNGDQT